MKLPIACMQCLAENGKPSEALALVEFRDDGRYELTCHNGHTTTTILQQQRFEVLFDIGGHAILDGYYREAVSSFTSSLERFYEYFVKVVLLNKKVAVEDIEATWKHIAKQSERQFGAFMITYFSEFGQPPNVLSNSKVQFRNDVIHRGKIPSRQKAVDYGQAVLDVMRTQLIHLREEYPDGVLATTMPHLNSCRTEQDQSRSVSTVCISTILGWSIGEVHDKPLLENALAALKIWRKIGT
jgi:hypothetical protein